MGKNAKSKIAFAVASRRGKRSRRKGKVYEREVAAQYRELYGEGVKRGWQAREGHDAPDVENVPGLWVECKHHHRVNERAALEQALTDREKAGVHSVPVAHCKDDGKPALVVLQESEWFQLLARLQKAEAPRSAPRPVADTPESAGAKARFAAGAAIAFLEVFHPAQPKLKNGS